MKKFLSLLLALLIIFSFTACGEADDTLSDISQFAADLSELAEELDSSEPSSEELEIDDPVTEASSEEIESEEPASETTELPTVETISEEETLIETSGEILDEYGTYTSKDDVALYIHLYGKLPENFMTKNEARDLGWEGGSLEPYAPGMCIGGDRFGNYEELLPTDRKYRECDIDTLGASSRGAKRIVFSEDGLIYYTDDHYETFELLYGEP